MHAYQHILIPVDFSPVSQRMINRGKELASQYHSQITLLTVVQDVPLSTQAFGDVPSITVEPEVQARLMASAHDQLLALAKQLEIESPAKLEVIEGLPYDAIMDYASDHKVDLIIVGHSAKKGLLGFIMGSTSESLVKHAKCDVFVMHAPKEA